MTVDASLRTSCNLSSAVNSSSHNDGGMAPWCDKTVVWYSICSASRSFNFPSSSDQTELDGNSFDNAAIAEVIITAEFVIMEIVLH